MSKGVSNDVLKMVKNKTGKNVTEKDIHNIAKTVTPKTLQSEAQLRQLIKQVGQMVNIDVAESTVNEIVQAVKKTGMNSGGIEQMLKMFMPKK